MNSLMRNFCGLAALGAALFAAPSLVRADTLAVSGGGMATFDAFDGGTVFSVQAQIDSDGNVSGHFFCEIAHFVVINGDDLVAAVVNGDGSVDLYGFSHGWFVDGGVFEDCPFAVRLWPGGPGVGKFVYDDPFVGPSGGVDLDEGDHETVEAGHIMISSH
jgi:hypothetical protein